MIGTRDPTKLKGLDRKSTILLQASREHIDTAEKGELISVEEPGMDALRGSFGAFGSMIRARSVRNISQNNGSNTAGRYGHRRPHRDEEAGFSSNDTTGSQSGLTGMQRHQLYDAPVPRPSSLPPVAKDSDGRTPPMSATSPRKHIQDPLTSPNATPRVQKIQFDNGPDNVHYYPGPGQSGSAVHETRQSHFNSPRAPSPPEYDDEDPPFDPSRLRSQADRFRHQTGSNSPTQRSGRPLENPFGRERGESDPFRDNAGSGGNESELNLLSSATSSNPSLLSDRDGASSPEDVRRPFHSRTRAYPGDTSSDEDDEGGARESLVAHDSGSTRGGIRLIPSKSSDSPLRQ